MMAVPAYAHAEAKPSPRKEPTARSSCSLTSCPVCNCANIVSMTQQESVLARKKKRDPVPTGIIQIIGVRMPPDELARLDAYIADQSQPINRPTAIRNYFRPS